MVHEVGSPHAILPDHDPSHRLDDDAYHAFHDPQRVTLGALQRRAHDAGIPVIVLLEGGYGAGISTVIRELNRTLDPRGFSYYPIFAPGPLAREHHFFWRFWIRTPENGRIAIFDRGWYARTLLDRTDLRREDGCADTLISEIQEFERTLADSGALLIKVYLHISKKEQKQRLKKIKKDPLTMDHIDDDLDRYIKYSRYIQVIDTLLARTSMPFSPWNVVDAEDKQYAVVEVFDILARQLGVALDRTGHGSNNIVPQVPVTTSTHTARTGSDTLGKADLSLSLSRHEYDERISDLSKALAACQIRLYREKIPLLLLFEGWDAAGKGGNIMRITRALNPRGYSVMPVGPPDNRELAHHYLWRFMPALPARGHITIFDRTWYGRVLVERVESLCSREEWSRAYREINEFEHSLAGDGAIILKFWLHIDSDEQLRRFREREEDPDKRWKITPDDWKNRSRWEEYSDAVNQMIHLTSTQYAPWTVVEANDKYYSRIKTLQTIVDAVNRCLHESSCTLPTGDE